MASTPSDHIRIARIQGILFEPRAEWQRIEAEPRSMRSLLLGWILPLAAIGPVANMIGSLVFGHEGTWMTTRPVLGYAIGKAVIDYVVMIAAAFAVALTVAGLAPHFGGKADRVRALKLVAGAGTALWLAQGFQLVPQLSFLVLPGGIYALYLAWLGTPVLMRSRKPVTLAYLGVAAGACAGIYLAAVLIEGALTSLLPSQALTRYGWVAFG